MDYYTYLPKGSAIRKTFINDSGKEVVKTIFVTPPHMQCSGFGINRVCWIIPVATKDLNVECVGINDCFIEINRGYKCKKHATK